MAYKYQKIVLIYVVKSELFLIDMRLIVKTLINLTILLLTLNE